MKRFLVIGCGFSRDRAHSLLVPTIKICAGSSPSMGFISSMVRIWPFPAVFGSLVEAWLFFFLVET